MHYKELIEGHRVFYKGEYRANNYDRYMKEQKIWEMWSTPYIPLYEIEKLFRFIRSWDRFFQGEPRIFQKIFSETFPIIEKMRHERIENADFSNNELKNAIKEIFDKTANCTLIGRYESTDASKILHTILPHFLSCGMMPSKMRSLKARIMEKLMLLNSYQ